MEYILIKDSDGKVLGKIIWLKNHYEIESPKYKKFIEEILDVIKNHPRFPLPKNARTAFEYIPSRLSNLSRIVFSDIKKVTIKDEA